MFWGIFTLPCQGNEPTHGYKVPIIIPCCVETKSWHWLKQAVYLLMNFITLTAEKPLGAIHFLIQGTDMIMFLGSTGKPLSSLSNNLVPIHASTLHWLEEVHSPVEALAYYKSASLLNIILVRTTEQRCKEIIKYWLLVYSLMLPVRQETTVIVHRLFRNDHLCNYLNKLSFVIYTIQYTKSVLLWITSKVHGTWYLYQSGAP